MLRIMHYVNGIDLSLSDVEKCASECGYECQSFFFFGPCLNILFEKGLPEDPIDYCRFNDIISDISQLEPKHRRALSKVEINPASILSIEYDIGSLQHMASLLKCILNCYGGWVLLLGKLYNLENIESILLVRFD